MSTLEEKMQAVQNGDKGAYRALMQEITPMVKGYIGKKLGADNIDDVYQEVLLAIHKARASYNPARPFKSWMYAITSYKINDYLRKYYKEARVEIDKVPHLVSEDVTFDNINSEELTKMLSILNERQKEIIMRMKLEGYSAREVGKKLDMSETAVKVASHRAMKKMQEYAKQLEAESNIE